MPIKNGDPRFYEILDELATLHSQKNADFSGGKNSYVNFQHVSTIMGLYPGMDWASPLGVAMVYALKQLDAALMLASTQRKSETGEPISSRMRDIAVYAVIMEILSTPSSAAHPAQNSPPSHLPNNVFGVSNPSEFQRIFGGQ